MLDQTTAAELARTFNLRELGGLPTATGHELRRGLLYRSASLTELSPGQCELMQSLDIRSIIDLRFNSERALHPTPWRALGCTHYWFRDHEPEGGQGLNMLLGDEGLTASASRDLMMQAYRDLPCLLIEAIRTLFETAASAEGALLFHCTSGKDRTGIAAALILSMLGVARDLILADYLATRQFEILASPAYRDDTVLSGDRLEAIRPIFGVHADYFNTMIDRVTARTGSVEGFLLEEAGLHPATLNAVRRRLLI